MIMMMLVVPSSIELLKKQPLEGKTASCTNTSEIIFKSHSCVQGQLIKRKGKRKTHQGKENSSSGKKNVTHKPAIE